MDGNIPFALARKGIKSKGIMRGFITNITGRRGSIFHHTGNY
jgi:hypothetical protein